VVVTREIVCPLIFKLTGHVMTATVLSGAERRRRWTSAEKLRIVEESLTGEASVAEVARRHDVHANLLHL